MKPCNTIYLNICNIRPSRLSDTGLISVLTEPIRAIRWLVFPDRRKPFTLCSQKYRRIRGGTEVDNARWCLHKKYPRTWMQLVLRSERFTTFYFAFSVMLLLTTTSRKSCAVCSCDNSCGKLQLCKVLFDCSTSSLTGSHCLTSSILSWEDVRSCHRIPLYLKEGRQFLQTSAPHNKAM